MPQECKYKMDDLASGLGCEAVMSGVKTVLVGLQDDIAVWPEEIATPTSLDENVKLSGIPVMKPGKRMFKLYCKNDAGEYKCTGQGEEGSRSQLASLEIYNPGFRAKISGFLRAVQNAQLVLIPLTNQGEWHFMGDRYRGAVLAEFEATSGKATTDANGANMTFNYNTPSDRVIELTDEQVEALCTVAEDDSDHTAVSGTFECEADTMDSDNPTINVVGNIQANDDTIGLTLLQMVAGSNIWVADVVPDSNGDFSVTVPGKEGASVVSPVSVTLLTHVITGGQHIMKSLGNTQVAVS